MPSPSKFFVFLLAAVWVLAPAPAAMGATHPVRAPHAMVVTVHEIASQVGIEIMHAGGNAVDAAVATGFALAVVHPAAGNIGGGGFMLIRMADGKTHFLDYREKAPAAATRDMYLDANGNVIEGASELGYKSIGVPGSVAGMVYAEQKYGKLGLKQVMAPAIKLAREGYALTWNEAADLHDSATGEVSRIASRLSAQRRLLQARRYISASQIWRARWSGSRRTPTIFITARWRRNWLLPCKKAVG